MPDIGGNALAAFEQGREQKIKERGQNALATILGGGEQTQGMPTTPGGIGGYAGGTFDPATGKQVTPTQQPDPMAAAWNDLYRADPRMALQLRQDQQQQQKAQQEAADKAREGAAKYVANAAFQIITLPEAQRAQAWDAYIDQASGQFPELAQYKGQYTPQALQALVAEAGKSQEFAQFQRPTYVPIGEQGLAGFQFGQPIQQGGQPQNFAQSLAVPQAGTVEDGYRFKGGNPADPNAWEPVAQGGPTAPQSGGFRP